jgi:hypothetical protein
MFTILPHYIGICNILNYFFSHTYILFIIPSPSLIIATLLTSWVVAFTSYVPIILGVKNFNVKSLNTKITI